MRSKVDPFGLPSEGEAMRLIRKFFATTGLLFPYLDEEAFVETYQQLASSNVRSSRRSWLALLNMILAMATHAGRDEELSGPEVGTNSNLFLQRALVLCEVEIRCASSLEIGKRFLFLTARSRSTNCSHSAITPSDESISPRHRTLY